MADKKLGDFITIALAKGTQPSRIYRKDMTDEEWDRVKKNADESGHLVLSSGLEGGDAPVDLNDRQSVKDTINETEPVSREEQIRLNKEQQAADDAKREKPSLVQEITREVKRALSSEDKKKAADATEEKRFFADNPQLPPESTGKGDGKEYKTGPDGELVPVHRWQPKGTVVSPGVLKVDPTVDPELGPAPEPGILERIAGDSSPFGQLGKGLGETVSGLAEVPAAVVRGAVNTIMPDQVKPTEADPLDAGTPAPAVVQPPVAAAPPPGTGSPPPGPGGSLAVGMKSTKPGAGGLPAPADPYAEDRKKMESAAQHEMDAIGKKSEVETARSAAESKILEDKINFTAENEKKRIAAVNTYEETLARGQQAMNSIMDERRALMNTKVDPDAYFTKGGTGRMVLAAISGALHGWTGQGPQFLQRLDNLMQQEVKNQQDELARKSGELSLIAGDKKNVIAMAREQGMTQIESLAAARVSFYQSVQDQLAKVAADNPMIAPNAMQRIAEIEQEKAKHSMLLTQATQTAAHQNVQDRIAMMRAQTERMELSAKLGMGGKLGGGWQEMKPSQQKDIQGLLAVGRQIGEMSKQWKDQAGSPIAALTQHLGLGMEATDPSKWKNSSSKFHAQTIGTVLEKGKLTDADFPKYLDSFIPSAGNTKEAALNRINNLVKYAVTQYATEINSLDAALVKSIGLPTPAEYQGMLVRDINDGSGGPVPTEKPYGAR